MALISLIVPCFNEEKTIPYFYDEVSKLAEQMYKDHQVSFEFIFVDDGSKDNTLAVMKTYSQKDERVHYISFTRNFGKEAAMNAGFIKAKGDYVGVIDVDLQHPPALLEQMYLGIKEEGYDCVASRRKTREGEPKIRSFFSKTFYKVINKISQTEIVDSATDYRLMSRPMVDSLLQLTEYNRFSKGLFSWVGYNTKWLEFENTQRVEGETKWSFWSLLRYSMDGILAFSTAPLSIASFMGVLFCIISFIMILVIVVKTLIWGEPVAGFPTLICIIFLLGGLILLSLGVIGQYIAKMYLEVKKRPIFLIKEEDHL